MRRAGCPLVNRSEFGFCFCSIGAGQSQIYQAKCVCHSDKPSYTLPLPVQMAGKTFFFDMSQNDRIPSSFLFYSHHKWSKWVWVLLKGKRGEKCYWMENSLFSQLRFVFNVIKSLTNFSPCWQWTRCEFYSEYWERERWSYNENIVLLYSFHSNKTFTWNDSNRYHRITVFKWVYWIQIWIIFI